MYNLSIPLDLYKEISYKLLGQDLVIYTCIHTKYFDCLYFYNRLLNDFEITMEWEDYYGEIINPQELYLVMCETKDPVKLIDYALENGLCSLLTELLLKLSYMNFSTIEEHPLYKSVIIYNDCIASSIVCAYLEDFSSIDMELLIPIVYSAIRDDKNVELYNLMEDIFSTKFKEGSLEGENYQCFKSILKISINDLIVPNSNMELIEAILLRNGSNYDILDTTLYFAHSKGDLRLINRVLALYIPSASLLERCYELMEDIKVL